MAAEGVELVTAWVRLVPTITGLEDQVTKELGGPAMESAGQEAGSKWSMGAKLAMTAGAAVLAKAVTNIFETGMEELKFGEQINAQTDQLVKNTGFAMSTDQIGDYTLALSQLSGISEEDLQAAGNNILKFGDISAESYQKAVASVNDMAAAGKDAAGTAEALGKALADPEKAAALLKRQGVLLNEEQQALIASFVEAGDKAGAQGVILDALEGTYGGMAEATGDTLQGNLNKLNNAWENLAGDAVTLLMPAIEGVVGLLQGAVSWISENEGLAQTLAIGLGVLAAAWAVVTAAMWAASLTPVAITVAAIVAAVGLLTAGVVWLATNWDTAWNTVSTVFTNVWNGFSDVVKGAWNGILDLVEGGINGVIDLINGMIGGINDVAGGGGR